MIDMDTHRMIDMIPSRVLEDVTTWLKSFPNLQIFFRDGSVIYKKAINQAHQNNIQISDRFHILKNLTDYAKDALKNILKKRVFIERPYSPMTEQVVSAYQNQPLTFSEKCREMIRQISEGEQKSKVAKDLKMDIRTINKLLNMSKEEREAYLTSRKETTQEEKQKKKQEMVEAVRRLLKEGLSYKEVAKQTGLCRQTVKKYSNSSFSVQHGSLGMKREAKLTPFYDEIEKLYKEGWKSKQIFLHLQAKGCTASFSTLSHHLSHLKKEQLTPLSTSKAQGEYIFREKIISLLYRSSVEENSALTEDQFQAIREQYSSVYKILQLVWDFKQILKNQEVTKLQEWMNTAKDMNIERINSFITGIERDYSVDRLQLIRQFF